MTRLLSSRRLQVHTARQNGMSASTRIKLTLSLSVLAGLFLLGCFRFPERTAASNPTPTSPVNPTPAVTVAANTTNYRLFQDSWHAYQQKFIQADGRVIDWETDDQRTTSEGQAYAMLRAVLIDDPETFERVLQWGEDNLLPPDPSALEQSPAAQPQHLWAWKWGPNAANEWGILDANFASDADIDAVTALILAARRWQRPEYLTLARQKLADLWTFSTLPAVVNGQPQRYLLPGPQTAFHPTATTLYLNPSYLAPYAFRLFAQVDPDHDWLSLVTSSYQTLEEAAQLSTLGLPSNWVKLDLATGEFAIVPPSATLETIYGFDAYRVWWRVALDALWFQSPEADQYLRQHLPALVALWQQQQRIPAKISLAGEPLVNYESTAQYAMVYSALQRVDTETANTLRQQKLIPTYQEGFWDSESAYYTQNLAWLGLFPPEWVLSDWLQAPS